MNLRRWLRAAGVVAVVLLAGGEIVLAWPWITEAVEHLTAPRPGWLVAATLAEAACIGTYARMQRRVLHSGGVDVPVTRHLAIAYAARSLSITLPGGAAFAMRFKYTQLRRSGATPAIASWVVGLSAVLSSATFAVITVVGALLGGGSAPWLTLAGFLVLAALLAVGLRWLRHPTRLRWLPERATAFLAQLGTARLTAADAGPAVVFAGLSWVFDALSLWLCGWALDVRGTDTALLLLAYCAAMAAGTWTVVPAGLGIIDGALVVGLVTAGAGSAAALATVVLYRIVALGLVGGVGWLVWLVLRRADARRTPVPASADELGGQ